MSFSKRRATRNAQLGIKLVNKWINVCVLSASIHAFRLNVYWYYIYLCKFYGRPIFKTIAYNLRVVLQFSFKNHLAYNGENSVRSRARLRVSQSCSVMCINKH